MSKFSACGGLFPLIKSSFWDPKMPKFSACGGLFPLVKSSFWDPKMSKISACGGLFPFINHHFEIPKCQNFPPAAGYFPLENHHFVSQNVKFFRLRRAEKLIKGKEPAAGGKFWHFGTPKTGFYKVKQWIGDPENGRNWGKRLAGRGNWHRPGGK